MSWLSKAFGFSGSPQTAANQYLNQITPQAQQAYNPYIQQGQQAGQQLGGQYNRLMTDPTGFIDEIMGKYKGSEGYKSRQSELMSQLNNTAAAGGFAGTPYAQKQVGDMTNNLMNQDQQQYLQNALGAYNTGLGGEQGFQNQGFQATQGLNDITSGALNQQGGLAFNAVNNKNMGNAQLMQALMSALGGGLNFGTNATGQLFGHKLWG